MKLAAFAFHCCTLPYLVERQGVPPHFSLSHLLFTKSAWYGATDPDILRLYAVLPQTAALRIVTNAISCTYFSVTGLVLEALVYSVAYHCFFLVFSTVICLFLAHSMKHPYVFFLLSFSHGPLSQPDPSFPHG